MEQNPIISVITPAYNVADYIERTIASVRAQTYANWQHIICDDGSTDNTRNLVRDAANADSRLLLVESDHRGSSAARNTAINVAGGEYIAFLDGDDAWEPFFLDRMLEALRHSEPNVVGAFGWSTVVDQFDQPTGDEISVRPGLYTGQEVLVKWNPMGNGSSLLLRSSATKAIRFRETMKSVVDTDYFLRVVQPGSEQSILCVGEFLTRYTVRPGNISSDTKKRIAGMSEVLNRYGPLLTQRQFYDAHVYPATYAFNTGHQSEGRAWSNIAMRGGISHLAKSDNGRAMLKARISHSPLGIARPIARRGTDVARKIRRTLQTS